MTILLPTVAIAFAASCVWLTVRIVNRRERWAKWTLAAVVGLPVLYVAGLGPACWWLSDLDSIEPGPNFSEIRRGPLMYWPIGYIAKKGPLLPECAIGWYATLGLDADAALYLPVSANDGLYYDLGPCSGIIWGKRLFH